MESIMVRRELASSLTRRPRRLLCNLAGILGPLTAVLWTGLLAAFAGGNCGNTGVGSTPLTELGTNTYLGSPGGLYPGGANELPPGHLADGLAQGAHIQPRDASGLPDANGKIGVVALGMSNAQNTFAKFAEMMAGLYASNVVFVNAAQGGQDAAIWANRASGAWSNALVMIANAGLSTNQVQVVLNYHAVAHLATPAQPWPGTPQDLQSFCETIAGHIHTTFPQTRLAFWATREYGGYSTSLNNPEPFAYRSGFGIKWLIEKQITGHPDLNFDPARGPVKAPWLAWGPYTWADGLNPRADGLVWECRDFTSDGTHPRDRGRAKLAGPWATLLRTSPLTAPWFNPPGHLSPLVTITFPPNNTLVPTAAPVALEAHAQDDDGSLDRVEFWTGGSLLGTDTNAPWSVLWLPPGVGDYPIHAVACDNGGLSRTSIVVMARIRAPLTNNPTLASDSFESGDFLGGGGWNQSAWIISGTPSVTNSAASPDGAWHALLPSGASLARSLNLSNPTNASLNLSWRGTLPAGAAFLAEINDGTWRTLFNSGSGTQAAFQSLALPLTTNAPSANFGLRFRVTGSGAMAAVDDVRMVSAATNTSATLRLAAARFSTNGFVLRWPAVGFVTYPLHRADALTNWRPLHVTTAEDDGELAWTDFMLVPQQFHRLQQLSP